MSSNRGYSFRTVSFLTMLLIVAGLACLLTANLSAKQIQNPKLALERSEGSKTQNRQAPAPDDKSYRASDFTPDTHCVPDWSLVNSPDVGADRNQLMGVAAVSSANVWAVGTYLGWPYQPIIEHWDGTQWSLSPYPDLGGAGALRSVMAISANDVWAVGYYDSGNRRWRALALHWDGTEWTQVPTPSVGSGSNYLFGVTALAPNNVWAVGSYCCVRYQQQTLVLHWNGASWQLVASPSVPSLSNSLYAVSAVSASDVWAVGAYGAYDNRQTLIEHWDGTSWSVSGVSRTGALLGVEALTPNKVWAVGYTGSSFFRQTLILRLTDEGWEVAPSPNPGNADNILYDIASVADDDIWAVGSLRNGYSSGKAQPKDKEGPGYGIDETLIVHWDGGQWTTIPSPNRYYEPDYLYGIDVVSANEMWVVGESRGYYSNHTFVARYAGRINFYDVWEWEYFYEAVRGLYCMGAVSGYSDNTFRPYNNTTRAQLCKIVVLAHGWPIDTTGGPHFSDVPTANPFYRYVETAYNHEVIAGYSDGTFRPGNDVTRAQLCKVVVLAGGWPINTTGGPHFSDVPTTHPFYGYVETAYDRDVILGYADGTFLPGNSATRGQICKIVYQAITLP